MQDDWPEDRLQPLVRGATVMRKLSDGDEVYFVSWDEFTEDEELSGRLLDRFLPTTLTGGCLGDSPSVGVLLEDQRPVAWMFSAPDSPVRVFYICESKEGFEYFVVINVDWF